MTCIIDQAWAVEIDDGRDDVDMRTLHREDGDIIPEDRGAMLQEWLRNASVSAVSFVSGDHFAQWIASTNYRTPVPGIPWFCVVTSSLRDAYIAAGEPALGQVILRIVHRGNARALRITITDNVAILVPVREHTPHGYRGQVAP